MPLQELTGHTGIVDIINKGLIFLRLPLLPTNIQVEQLGHQDDAAVIWHMMHYNHKKELTKGWWFNTVKNHEVDAIGTSFYVVPTPGNIDVLSMTNTRRNCHDDYEYTRYKFNGGGNIIVTENHLDAEHKGLINYTYPVQLYYSPPVYIDYIVKASTQEFATVMDMPFNAELVDNALFELEKEQAKHREKLNVFTRRR